MRKITAKALIFLLVVALAAVCLVACDDQNQTQSQPNVVIMTESYAKARTEFAAVTGITVPEWENLEAAHARL